MREQVVAKRYAQAFIEYAQETIGVDRAAREMKNLKSIARYSPEFESFLKNPQITDNEKNGFLEEVLKKGFSEEIRHFIKLLVEKRRTMLLISIADYIRMNYSHGEAQDAVLKTAYPLELSAIKAIKKKAESRLDKKLNFFIELDGSLLGGAQIVVGNIIIDGTVRKRLDDLRRKISKVRVV